MLASKIIPCLDLRDGRIVKGINFLDLKDAGDPVETALIYDQTGADELVLLDITATTEKRKTTKQIIRAIADRVSIPLTVGGGISSLADIEDVLAAGATKVSLNSAALKNPELIEAAAKRFGSESITVAIDVSCQNSGFYEVMSAGGSIKTGLEALAWAKQVAALGAGSILLTSMDKDGTGSGYDLNITRKIAQATKLPVIASGGAGSLHHFYDALTEGQATAVLAAGIFHFGKIRVNQLKDYLALRGIKVMPTKVQAEAQKGRLAGGFMSGQDFPQPIKLPQLDWAWLKKDDQGLVAAIIREEESKEILMLAWLNQIALKETLATGLMHYYSRSRKQQWLKGEESGHFQQVRSILVDCDQDALLIDVFQLGAACHTGHKSCFYRDAKTLNRPAE